VIACLDQSGVWDDELRTEGDLSNLAANSNTPVTPVTPSTAPNTPVARPQLSKSVSQPLSLVRAVQSKITTWFKTDTAPNTPVTRVNSAVHSPTRLAHTPPQLTRSYTVLDGAKNNSLSPADSPTKTRQVCPFYKRVPHTPIIGK